uniref:Uncharacterized protein n=1 Tax=Megaselia scalaris TaxID=36166 RepID=T1GU20_MEGSC
MDAVSILRRYGKGTSSVLSNDYEPFLECKVAGTTMENVCYDKPSVGLQLNGDKKKNTCSPTRSTLQ